MGCNSSAPVNRFATIDDSRHVRLSYEKKVQKSKNETPHKYVARAAHPMLKPKESGEGPPTPSVT